MGWTLFFMIVILKIPMIAALWLVWYAVKAVPEPEEDTAEDDRGPQRAQDSADAPAGRRTRARARRRRLQACALPAGAASTTGQ